MYFIGMYDFSANSYMRWKTILWLLVQNSRWVQW